ncbi:MAG: hypothetical protein MZW92_23835 [Comamonadaceae bacterium]|nr:hypothetical protein [Comamonadaceae bacterium]
MTPALRPLRAWLGGDAPPCCWPRLRDAPPTCGRCRPTRPNFAHWPCDRIHDEIRRRAAARRRSRLRGRRRTRRQQHPGPGRGPDGLLAGAAGDAPRRPGGRADLARLKGRYEALQRRPLVQALPAARCQPARRRVAAAPAGLPWATD